MSWRGLRHKGRERLFRHEWNAVVDTLNDLYGWLTSGQQDIYVDEVYGRAGYFSESLLVQGRPVLKDGDPITVQQFYDVAVDQITGAIDRSRATQFLESYAPRLATIEEYTRETRDVLVRVSVDEYGNVGVRIAEPLDVYGRVLVSVPSERIHSMELKAWGVAGCLAVLCWSTGIHSMELKEYVMPRAPLCRAPHICYRAHPARPAHAAARVYYPIAHITSADNLSRGAPDILCP